MTEQLPFVSVVIPTRNRARLLDDCLASLRRQDYPRDRFEIVVVDDASTDRTSTVAAEFASRTTAPRLRYVRGAGRGTNAARNAGARAAIGDPICFVDDDVDLPDVWLTRLVDGAQRYSDAECLGGPIRLRAEGAMPRMCGGERLGETEFDLGPDDVITHGVFGANMALRRAALARVGEFNEALSGPGDDEEWQRRLWARRGVVVYIADAWLWHRRTAEDLTLRRLVRKRFVWGVKEVAFLELIGERVSPRRELRGAFEGLTHAVTHRCAWGLFAASWRLGRACGSVLRRRT